MYATSKQFILLTTILLLAVANGGVLRTTTTTTTTTTRTLTTTAAVANDKGTAGLMEIEKSDALTTTEMAVENTEANFLPKDMEEQLLTTTEKDEQEDTTESKIALSRDEDASIKVPAIKNPDAEVLKIDTTPKSDDAESAKLLLLSSLPKSNEKTREFEENIVEPKLELSDDEYKNAGTIGTTLLETTTMALTKDDTGETTTNDSNSDSNSTVLDESNVAVTTTTTRLQIVQEMEQQPHVDNAANAVLEVETSDGDYVILDESEYLEQDMHYAPIVHSVEIVPTRLEGELLEDFVHNW